MAMPGLHVGKRPGLAILVVALLVTGWWAPQSTGVPTTQAATLTVCPTGCQFTSIQDAVNHAGTGDTITISVGIYRGTITIPLSVTLVGSGASATIIDGNQSGTVVTVNAGATVAISGVTVQDGFTG